jgi:hypothetical protein
MVFKLISLTHSQTVHFIMDNAQLKQLLGVIRVSGGGGHKTSKFSSAEGTEWFIWRRNFEQTLQINGWANERCQREAAAAMESTAAEFTSDIPPFVQGRPIQDMLNLYKTRFLPAATGQLAAAQFQTAAQMDGEQIAVWHARLRTIFERAFPGKNIQNSRLLINKFVLKLADSNIWQWTHRANPATYYAAMSAASNEAASQSILAHEAGSGGKGNVAINAFGGRGGSCFGCGSYDHQVAACPLARPDQHRDSSKPRGRGRPQGGRGGRGRGRGRGGGVGFKQTYLQTRGRGGTRGAPVKRGFNNNSNRNGGVNGVGGEDEQYESYYNELDTTRNGGVNGIGGEDEQYEEYYNELDTQDTISLNKDNGEPDQESWEENEDDHSDDNNLYNLDTRSLNKANGEPDQENWEGNEDDHSDDNNLYNYMEARNTATTNGDQVPGCRWGNDWNEADKEEINKINQHFNL